jgi:fatty acid desaturase
MLGEPLLQHGRSGRLLKTARTATTGAHCQEVTRIFVAICAVGWVSVRQWPAQDPGDRAPGPGKVKPLMSTDVSADMAAVVAEPSRLQQGSDYSELSRRVKAAGLLRRRPGYYTLKITLTVALFLAGWVVFVMLGSTWWQLLTAAFLGVMFTQLAFLGHDSGHKQVFRTRRGTYAFGLLGGNLGVGLSYGWWMDKHNRHHAHPNDLERDPDVGAGALAFDPSQTVGRHGLARVLTSKQAYLFFPMLMLEALHLHLASVRALRSGVIKARWTEGSLLLAHIVAYLTVVAVVLPLGQAIAFVAVQQGVFGLYMGLSFAPNHKGMPLERPEDHWDYLRRQVITSRNIKGSPIIDLLLGGLNYQIEHHLFPSLPRPSLKRVQPLVREFCAERGVPYVECSVVSSYGQAVGHLNAVGRA